MIEKQYLPTEFQQFIATSRYARWSDSLGRRETWPETVARYFKFFTDKLQSENRLSAQSIRDLEECQEAVLNLEVMPSMRALMTAGEALRRDNVAGFNCSYIAIDHPHAFDEVLYVLCCGVGAGFSVEQSDVNKLQEIPAEFYKSESVISVPDSKIGWATSYRELISMLFAGKIPKWDVSKVRPAGARLKVFGGRASGSDPLVSLFKFTIDVFKRAAGRKLKPIECHDIVCKIADVVVVGGVRRSALISLSDLSDGEMRHSKSGNWWEKDVQRRLANNSAVYESKPDIGSFMDEWVSLFRSGSGERGIFNRYAVKRYIGELPNRDASFKFGTNPCSEILMRSCQFCNLTSVQIAPLDTLEDLKKKVRVAAILGTLQSSLTDFRYLRKIWKRNSEEECLLGVSLSGICDHSVMSGRDDLFMQEAGEPKLVKWLSILREEATSVNKDWAARLEINPSTAITCVKPEGTTSQLCDRASGIHPRFSPFYIRTVRADKKDPLATMMKDAGFPVEDDVTKPGTTYVFSFPVKAPKSSVMRDDMTAIDQLNLWLIYKKHWADHTVSCTVYVRDSEWLAVADWVYSNFDDISGLSFLPHTNHVYKQPPYAEIDESEYNRLVDLMPKNVDWSKLSQYELDDQTTSAKELACSGGACELI